MPIICRTCIMMRFICFRQSIMYVYLEVWHSDKVRTRAKITTEITVRTEELLANYTRRGLPGRFWQRKISRSGRAEYSILYSEIRITLLLVDHPILASLCAL